MGCVVSEKVEYEGFIKGFNISAKYNNHKHVRQKRFPCMDINDVSLLTFTLAFQNYTFQNIFKNRFLEI